MRIDPQSLLRADQVADLFGVCERTIVRWSVGQKDFPQPLRIGSRYIRWRADEVAAYIQNHATVRERNREQ